MKGQFRRNRKLYTGPEFTCTNIVPGRKCNNGGEYGFYTTYTPTEKPGKYAVRTSTTCDFDACGTGFKGFIYLTVEDVEKLLEKSEEVKKRGCLYGVVDILDIPFM